jgi:hypothetical protein
MEVGVLYSLIVTIGFFVEVEGSEEPMAFGSFSSEIDGWIAFEGSPIGGDCYLGWCCWLLSLDTLLQLSS